MKRARWGGTTTFGLLAALLIAALSSPAPAAPRIVKKPPAVKYREFDPANPPKDMPPLERGHTAMCTYVFGADVALSFDRPAGRRQPDGRYRGSIVADVVRADLTLSIVVWLPLDASAKLKAHEEGHRQITEKVYAEVADKAIRVAIDKVHGRRFEGYGETAKDAETAARDALNAAHTALIQAYMAETSAPCKKIQDKYDALTEYGGKFELLEPEAIRQAWAAHPPPLWTPPKAPATKPAAATTRPVVPATKPAGPPR